VIRTFRKGAILIEEGTHGDTLYVLLKGTVKAFSADHRGREIVYGTYGPGEYVGEMSLDGGPRSASIVTLEATLCALITRASLRAHIAANPDFAFELIERVIRRVRVLTDSARSLALLDVYGRLVRLLNAVAVQSADGVRTVEPRPTHSDLAGRIGASREMVSRLLKDLENGGYVAVEGAALVLVKPLPPSW
jgi:CRP/FNR family cyclic AMP-dependent transcriptional regulator